MVLSNTYEYRQPSEQQVRAAAAAAASSGGPSVKLDMTSRYLGLVVLHRLLSDTSFEFDRQSEVGGQHSIASPKERQESKE